MNVVCCLPGILTHSYPCIVEAENIKILQMSAGVDMSMAVSTSGNVYAWGKADGGRLGLGLNPARISTPRLVSIVSGDDGKPLKAVDVECGYVHCLIVALNGTVHQCGRVGVDGKADGQQASGFPKQLEDFNIWHRIPEPKERKAKQERWKKYGTYEVKGRQKMMEESVESALK